MAAVSEKATGDAVAQTPEVERSTANDFNLVAYKEEAANATQQEHDLTLVQAFKLYPKACFWSIVVSLVIIMEGYDTALIGSLYGFPSFQRRFGYEISNTGNYQLEPKWQTALGMGGSAAGIVAIFINSMVAERIGHRKTLIINLVILTGCIFILFFAQNIEILFAGGFLCGIPWGVFTTLAPVYASEVAPVALRGYLETYVVLCWGFGQLLAFAVLDSLESNMTNWAWRIPFAVQWVWPVIIIPLLIICPESPWWLVRQGRLKQAERSVRRLTSFNDDQKVRNAVSLMVETTALERKMTEGATYLDCFRKTNLWRTEISCCVYIAQVLVGFALTQYANYFFEQAGLTAANSYKLTVGQGGLNVICTLLSCFITHRHGRRTMYIAGCSAMATSMFVIGFLSLAKETPAVSAASAAFYMLWFCLYLLTLGPASYIILGEVSSTRLRSHTIALGRNAYNVMNIISSISAPFILNPTADNWKGKSGFLAGGLALVAVFWGVLRLPETKGRTYEELDILFAQNLKPRQFKGYEIDREQFIADKFEEGKVEHME